MAWVPYHNFKKRQLNGNAIDLDTDTIKCMLVTASYTPSAANDDFIDDASANEVSGTNYTAGGSALSTKTVTLSSGTVTFDADDITFSQDASGFSDARYAILYKDTGTASTSGVIAYADLGADVGNVAGDLVIQMSASGILTLA